MKRFILSMTMLLCIALSSMAMSYEQARDRALFLTDKMAYELNLNDEQYEAAYEVNLDYLMSINTYDDLYGTYWTRRNLDLSYILLDWQYNAYCAAAYFYRPLAWTNGVWRFGIYARYPNRTYFYFGRPAFYATYYGGHSWHMNGGHSWYHGRTFGPRPGESRFGMRDRFDRGDFRGPRGDNRYDRNNNGRYDRNNGYNNRYDRNNNGRYDRNDNSGSRYDRNNNNGYRGQGNSSTSTPNRGTSTSSTTSRPQNDNQSNRGNGGNSGYRGGNNRNDNYSTDRSSTRMTVNREARNQVSRSSANVERTNPRTSVRSSIGGSPSVSRQTSAPSRPASTFSPSSSRSSQSSAPRSVGGGRSGGGGSFGGRR